MFGRPGDDGEIPPDLELVRLAFPRRVYTQSHVDYLVEVVQAVFANRERIEGFEIVEAPPVLRHFSARFQPLALT